MTFVVTVILIDSIVNCSGQIALIDIMIDKINIF